MSRNIANDHLWSDEEVEYQLSRSRHSEVESNRKLFGPGGELEGQQPYDHKPEKSDVLELDREVYEFVVGLNVDELRNYLKDNEANSSGTEQELRGRLAQILQAKRDDSNRS